ncbi:MAG: tetratricopeptide repeat protein [Pedosphaera sp.]|nr:tetratricopeptide repeat protein [Pedosphaera sp.]
MNPLEPPDIHYLQAAEGWLMLGDHLSAYEELEKISPKMNLHIDVLHVRWHINAKEKKWDECVDIGRTMVELAPEHVRSWVNHGNAYFYQRRYQKAYDVLHPALVKYPKESSIPYNLACYTCQLGNLKDAKEWLVKALEHGGNELKRQALNDHDLEPLWEQIREL